MIYERERTREFLGRLVAASRIVRIAVTVSAILVAVPLLSVTGFLLVDASAGIWLGAIFGFALGYLAGTYLSILVNLVLEWMGQMLVVQEALLAGREG